MQARKYFVVRLARRQRRWRTTGVGDVRSGVGVERRGRLALGVRLVRRSSATRAAPRVAAVAEVDGDRVVRVARAAPTPAPCTLLAAELQFDDAHFGPAVLAAGPAETSLATSSFSAVFGLTKAALSQVILVSGLGSSWSQPLLANRPS